jgi:hypothetical protein
MDKDTKIKVALAIFGAFGGGMCVSNAIGIYAVREKEKTIAMWKDIADSHFHLFEKLVSLTNDPDILRQVLTEAEFQRIVDRLDE